MTNDNKPKISKKPTEDQKKAAALRKELKSLIDVLPDRALRAIKPLLKYLAENHKNT